MEKKRRRASFPLGNGLNATGNVVFTTLPGAFLTGNAAKSPGNKAFPLHHEAFPLPSPFRRVGNGIDRIDNGPFPKGNEI